MLLLAVDCDCMHFDTFRYKVGILAMSCCTLYFWFPGVSEGEPINSCPLVRPCVRASRTFREIRSLDFSDFFPKAVGPEYEEMYVFVFWPKNLVLAILAQNGQNLAIFSHFGPKIDVSANFSQTLH